MASHRPLSAALALTCSLLFAGAAATVAPPTAQAATVATGSSLTVGPDAYVGGQAVVLKGSLGLAGSRAVHVESNMNRPGDTWVTPEDYPRATTAADGSFTLKLQAPDMFGISLRVVSSDGHATPARLFNAKTQEASLWVAGSDPADELSPGYPVASRPFTLSVDTTPELFRRPDTVGLPVFEGRTLTLQKRTSASSWATVATTRADQDGMGYFPNLVEDAGNPVYRVRLEDWTQGGSAVGWTATFPTYVHVRAPGEPVRVRQEGERIPGSVASPTSPKAPTGTAASKYHWYPRLWDFAWERGEDLDSKPKSGTRLYGKWLQTTTGAGRVSKHNGGLRIDSGRLVKDGYGDFGTTSASLEGNSITYGRVELRLRMKTAETASAPYTYRVELVPARAKDYSCGKRNITVAQFTGLSNRMTFGANNGTRKWRKTITIAGPASAIPGLATEVGRDHITWFVNGQPVGTVNTKQAVSGVPLKLRISLMGNGATEYNSTSLYSDWQRGFDLSHGKQVKSGAALNRSSLTSCPG